MAKLGRPTKPVVVTDAERRTLIRWTQRPRANRRLAFRARLVLACADGMPDTAVVRRYRTKNATVGKWRHRFIARRLDGLLDEPRVGAPRRISDDAVEAVIVTTLETTPPGETHWSTRAMAAKAGMSHVTVGRIWRTFGLKPHVTESFKISPDPQLIEKVRDVVGLYMHPPTNAVVFSFDEKSQIQALERDISPADQTLAETFRLLVQRPQRFIDIDHAATLHAAQQELLLLLHRVRAFIRQMEWIRSQTAVFIIVVVELPHCLHCALAFLQQPLL